MQYYNNSLFAFTWSSVFALYLGHTLMLMFFKIYFRMIILFLNAASNYRFEGLPSENIISENIMYILTSGEQV